MNWIIRVRFTLYLIWRDNQNMTLGLEVFWLYLSYPNPSSMFLVSIIIESICKKRLFNPITKSTMSQYMETLFSPQTLTPCVVCLTALITIGMQPYNWNPIVSIFDTPWKSCYLLPYFPTYLYTRVGHMNLMDYEFHFIRGNMIIHRNNKFRKFLELYN